jgi:hypothetical protein
LFFYEKEFKNFWFSTGTPTFLVNLLKQVGIFDLYFQPINLSGFESFDRDRFKPIAILFQTGYLTIQAFVVFLPRLSTLCVSTNQI